MSDYAVTSVRVRAIGIESNPPDHRINKNWTQKAQLARNNFGPSHFNSWFGPSAGLRAELLPAFTSRRDGFSLSTGSKGGGCEAEGVHVVRSRF